METTSRFDERDSAPFVPKSVVVDPNFDWQGEYRRRSVPWDHTIVYETHVKGFTKLHPEVDENLRGFYAGLGSKRVIEYLRSLGVTTVELMPVHTFVDDAHLLEKGLRNYWGYNSIGFFAPDPRYAADVANSLREFKEMIARLHDGGLEVILDVVYNHTAEGNERGPTLSFKGIDNRSYYRLLPDQPRYYINDTGTGNTLNLSHPRVIQMVADSLRYWVSEMRVDGFRFDLGTILAREPDGFTTESGFLKAVGQDPLLAEVKLIAEPWDCGPGGYQVGGFPPGWAEWNDTFRDTARDFWRGMASAQALAPRLCASPDKFNFRGRKPWASVNFVAAHDGFTLRDLVSYNDKHNEANGEDNRDGHSDNRSWNCGVEGPTDDPEIRALRLRQMRNFLATLMLSQGTPMISGGRRIRSDAERQQQRLLPGQRDQLGELADGRGGAGAGCVLPPPDRTFPPLSGPPPLALSYREDEPGHRRQGRDLDRRRRLGDDAGDVGQRAHPLLRHAARRAGAGDRHQAARR